MRFFLLCVCTPLIIIIDSVIMGLFKHFFSKGRNTLQRRSDTRAYDWEAGRALSAGKYVAVDSAGLAMKIATVYRCVDILSSGVASLPIYLKKLRHDGDYYSTYYDKINVLLNVRANRRLNGYDFKRSAIINMVLCDGNAYILPKYYGAEVEELILLTPHSVSYQKETNLYTVSDPVNHVYGTYRPEQIIHLKNMSIDGGYTGVTTLAYASHVLGISATADAQTADIVGKGGQLKMLLGNVDSYSSRGFGNYDNTEVEKLAEKVEGLIADGRDVISMPSDIKATVMSMTSADLQLLENKKFGVLEICRFFGVHPDKVFAGQSANYKASEMSQVSFLTDTLAPVLCKIETELLCKLVPETDWDEYKFMFDTTGLYTTDLQTKSAYYKEMIANGIYTVNEVRRREGMAPVDGGDINYITCNVQPIGAAGKDNNKTTKEDE